MDFFYQLESVAGKVFDRKSALLIIDSKDLKCRYPSFTSSSAKFLKDEGAIACEDDIVSKVFRRLMSSNSFDSTGWFTLIFSCKLIAAGLQSELSMSSISRGFTLASSAAINELTLSGDRSSSRQSIQPRKMSWDDLESILVVIKTTLSTRHILQLTQQQISKISISLLTAFLSSADRSNSKSCIIYRQALGVPIDNMIVLENTLAMDIPIPPSLICPNNWKDKRTSPFRYYDDLVVVFFENSLELSEFPNYSIEVTGHNEKLNSGAASETFSVKSLEYQFLKNVALMIKRSKITLVACQRRIHPYLVRLLQMDGIICLPRLSIRFCGALQRLCGARQLVSLPTSKDMNSIIDPSSLGYLARIEYRVIYGRKYVIATSTKAEASTEDFELNFLEATFGINCANEIFDRQSAMSTVVLTAPSEALCSELEAACEDAVRTLTSLLSSPYVLIGAGAWQIHTANKLQQSLHLKHCSATRKVDPFTLGGAEEISTAALMFVKCLRDCGSIIAGEAGRYRTSGGYSFDSDYHMRHVINENKSSVSDFHNSDNVFDVDDNCDDHLTPGISFTDDSFEKKLISEYDALDALVPCRTALQLAVDTAVCILDIDGHIISHPQEIQKNYN